MCHTQVGGSMQVPEPRRPFTCSSENNVTNSFFEEAYSASFRSKLYNMVEEIEQERAKYCNSANLSYMDAFGVEKESIEEDYNKEEDRDSLCSVDIADNSETSNRSSEDLLCDNCSKSLMFLNNVFKWNDLLFCNLDCYTSAILKNQKGADVKHRVACSLSPTWHKDCVHSVQD
ncbi:hypothetical protein Gasu2_10310 [Galdieria sulphuraria]|nr:hypothetical protein Gasu2_10310 [Galdieria sulphuraria]